MPVFVRLVLIAFIAVITSACSANEDATEPGTDETQQRVSNGATTTLRPGTAQEPIATEPPETEVDSGQPCVPRTDDLRTVADVENWVGYLEDCSTHDPLWVASVSLVCGSASEFRLVESFTANTNGRGEETRLYFGESGGRLWPLEVGDEFPAERRLAWQIPGFYLGPWEVDEILDKCDDTRPVDSPGPGRVVRVPEEQQVNPLELVAKRVMHADAGIFTIKDDGTRILTNLQSTSSWTLDPSSGPGSQQAGIYLISSDDEESSDSFLVMQTLWEARSFDGDDTEYDYLIHDVLLLPSMASNVSLFAYDCTLNGVIDVELVVMAEIEPDRALPIAAWRTNRNTRSIEPIGIDGVGCTNRSG